MNDEVTGSKLSARGNFQSQQSDRVRRKTANYRSNTMWMDVGSFVPGTAGEEHIFFIQ